jgi:hypothetical protein
LERTIHQLLVARAAGDPLTTAEQDRLARHEQALHRTLTPLRPVPDFASLKQAIVRADIEQMDAPKLRELVHALLANLELIDTLSAGAEGRQHKDHRQKRHGGQRSGATRREARAVMLATIEERKAGNPALSDEAAARIYLRETDPNWQIGPDTERDKKVERLLRSLRRARQKR